jgi:hypothetical protein
MEDGRKGDRPGAGENSRDVAVAVASTLILDNSASLRVVARSRRDFYEPWIIGEGVAPTRPEAIGNYASSTRRHQPTIVDERPHLRVADKPELTGIAVRNSRSVFRAAEASFQRALRLEPPTG